jgi:hypothetical protein
LQLLLFVMLMLLCLFVCWLAAAAASGCVCNGGVPRFAFARAQLLRVHLVWWLWNHLAR